MWIQKVLTLIALVASTSALLHNNSSDDERILESELVPRNGYYPFVAQIVGKLSNGNVWQCAGAILSDRFVLTTAVCGRTAPQGANVLTGSIERLKGSSVPIEQIIVHPEFKANGPILVNNLALIRTGQEIQRDNFTEEVRFATFPMPDNNNVFTVTTAGWGANSVRNN